MEAKPKTPAITRRIQTGAVELHVTEYGDSGPALFLVHGVGSRAVSWWSIIDRLARDFHLIAPDLRGHGGSDKPESGYLVSDYADDLAGLIDVYDVERPLIIGHSLGGMIAWEWASRHPNRAAAIVIEDSPLHGGASVVSRFDDWIEFASMTPRAAAERYQTEHPNWNWEDCERRAESITSTNLGVFREMRARQVALGDHDEDRFAPIAKIESPMLLIYGEESAGGMVLEHEAARFLEVARNGSVIQVPGGSHSLHRDFAEPFLAAATPLLERFRA